MTNILFLGGAGFIGSNLVHRFVKDSCYKVFVFEPTFANLQRIDSIRDRLTIIRGNIADFDLVRCVIEDHHIDVIVHLVSTLVPGSTYDDFKREFENIVFPSVRIMGLCADRGVKFIFFSSGGTVYGNSLNGEHFSEDHPLAPISYYGLTKQILENNVLFEHRRGNLDYLILRPSNPFGKGQSLHGNQGFIAVAIGKILAGEQIEVWGDGSSTRDYIYIDDLSDAFYKLMKGSVYNETVNLGSGHGYTVNDVIARLRSVIRIPFNVEYKESRSVDVSSMILDITKLESLVAVSHTHLEDGIKAFYEEVKSNVGC